MWCTARWTWLGHRARYETGDKSVVVDAQWRGVGLFQTMGLNDMVPWAELHRDIIARFGRFPHRNVILGRRSTAEELAFLAQGGFQG